MAVITISRETGCGGDRIARRVCEVLGYRYFDRALLAQVAHEQGISEAELVDFSEDNYRARGFLDTLLRRSPTVATVTTVGTTTRGEEARATRAVDEESAAAFVSSVIRGLWKRGQVVVVGRGGQETLRDSPGVLHVRMVARMDDRVQRVMQAEVLTREAALRLIGDRDRATAQYLRRFHDVDWTDPTLYHLTLNTSLVGEEGAAELIAAAARQLDTHSGAG